MSKVRVINVWHVGAWNRNVGDWALAYQMHRLLNEQAHGRDLHLKFYLVDSQRTLFHPALVDQINEEADLVLIGGGGLIFFRPEDKSLSGWSFNIAPSELERIRPPIVVYGVGYNKFRYDQNDFPEMTGPHLRQLQSKAKLFSVRNHGTRQILIDQFGLNAQNIEVIPDAGMCLYDRPIDIPVRSRTKPVVAVNWAGDRPLFRYPQPHEDHARHFLRTVKAALLHCVEELGAQIMFLPHLLHVDSDIYGEFSADFPRGSIFSTHVELPFLYPPPGEMLYPHVPFFTNLYHQADVVLGMRFHACVLAFGAETRFIPLGSHPKLQYFMQDVAVPDYGIALVDRQEDTAARVFEKIRSCLRDEKYGECLKRSLTTQLQLLRAFNEQLLDVLT